MANITNPILRPDLQAMSAEGVPFVNRLLRTIITFLLVIVVLVFTWMFIQGALKIILSEGDKGKIEEGQKQLSSAFTGLVIAFVLYATLRLIGHIFGITGLDTLTLPWPSI